MIASIIRFSGPVLLGLLFLIIGLTFFDVEVPSFIWWANLVAFVVAFSIYVVQQNLFKYVIKRVLESAMTLLVICTFTFLLSRLLPGGPFDQEKRFLQEKKELKKALKLLEGLR